jgi:hypothetical protein
VQFPAFDHLHSKEENEAGCETEDEDDMLPPPKRTGHQWSRSGAIEDAYDFRGRPVLETMRAATDIEDRFNMHRMLKDLEDEHKPEDEFGFTVMDSADWDMADHKRFSLRNTKVHPAEAAKQKLITRNAQAFGYECCVTSLQDLRLLL